MVGGWVSEGIVGTSIVTREARMGGGGVGQDCKPASIRHKDRHGDEVRGWGTVAHPGVRCASQVPFLQQSKRTSRGGRAKEMDGGRRPRR